jgi:hypothetical protein
MVYPLTALSTFEGYSGGNAAGWRGVSTAFPSFHGHEGVTSLKPSDDEQGECQKKQDIEYASQACKRRRGFVERLRGVNSAMPAFARRVVNARSGQAHCPPDSRSANRYMSAAGPSRTRRGCGTILRGTGGTGATVLQLSLNLALTRLGRRAAVASAPWAGQNILGRFAQNVALTSAAQSADMV